MLDQEKVGHFIAERRKGLGLTQRELAEQLKISDKTVSKWETGRGMPDVSVMGDLCEVLSITTNELLAGEDLPNAESFHKKAEENIMELMKDNQKAKRLSVGTLVGGLAGMVFLFLFLIASTGAMGRGWVLYAFIDLPSLFCVVGIQLLTLVASGRFKDFFGGIACCFSGEKRMQRSEQELLKMARAVQTAMSGSLLGGFFGMITGMITFFHVLTEPELLGPNLSVALISVFYGLVGTLVLLPFRERLLGGE